MSRFRAEVCFGVFRVGACRGRFWGWSCVGVKEQSCFNFFVILGVGRGCNGEGRVDVDEV